jgi:hypothetical protein
LTVGILEGMVIGVFSVVAGMMVKPRLLDLTAVTDLAKSGSEA